MALFSANAIESSVFPAPVGKAILYMPCENVFPEATHSFNISHRALLIAPLGFLIKLHAYLSKMLFKDSILSYQ